MESHLPINATFTDSPPPSPVTPPRSPTSTSSGAQSSSSSPTTSPDPQSPSQTLQSAFTPPSTVGRKSSKSSPYHALPLKHSAEASSREPGARITKTVKEVELTVEKELQAWIKRGRSVSSDGALDDLSGSRREKVIDEAVEWLKYRRASVIDEMLTRK